MGNGMTELEQLIKEQEADSRNYRFDSDGGKLTHLSEAVLERAASKITPQLILEAKESGLCPTCQKPMDIKDNDGLCHSCGFAFGNSND